MELFDFKNLFVVFFGMPGDSKMILSLRAGPTGRGRGGQTLFYDMRIGREALERRSFIASTRLEARGFGSVVVIFAAGPFVIRPMCSDPSVSAAGFRPPTSRFPVSIVTGAYTSAFTLVELKLHHNRSDKLRGC